MPELPEVERARKDIETAAKHHRIDQVEWASDDKIVFVNVAEGEFVSTLQGRTIVDVKRKGKVFWLVLSGEGKQLVLHFGMTGGIRIKGRASLKYIEGPKSVDDWPPKYMKFILTLSPPESSSESSDPVQIAFIDPRRLARIKFLQDPENEPPVSLLGPDPILSPPTDEEFKALLGKRAAPIKSVLLDQTVAAGVGNWVADEILYQARIHPLQQAKTLTDDELGRVREKMCEICRIAVECESESERYPPDWLFLYRWGKGKSKKLKKGEVGDVKGPQVTLKDGTQAAIEFLTIGGRTAAIVPSLQILPTDNATVSKAPKPKPQPKEAKGKAKGKAKSEQTSPYLTSPKSSKRTFSSSPLSSPSSIDPDDRLKPSHSLKKPKIEPAPSLSSATPGTARTRRIAVRPFPLPLAFHPPVGKVLVGARLFGRLNLVPFFLSVPALYRNHQAIKATAQEE